jgi:small-conductance mechanosensitive channel
VTLVRRRPLAGLAVLGAAALIAGCGGGGSDSLSADEFREQADAICADGDEATDALTAPTTPEQILPFLQTGLPISDEQRERIAALDPPDELQAAFDEAQDLNQQRRDLLQQAVERIEAGEDPEAVLRELDPQLDQLQEESRAKARELGLAVCGADDDDGTTTATTTGTAPAPTAGTAGGAGGTTAEYLEDVGAAVGSLQSFSGLLQGTTSLADLQSKVPEARAELDSFDAAVAELDGYSFDNATLEAQRAQLAATGPEVADQLRRFLTAAESGDAEAIQQVLPGVTRALTEFQDAATP